MKPGIHPSVLMSEYISDPCPLPSLSTSTIHTIIYRTLAHAHYEHPRFGNHRTESTAADIGTLAHQVLLGGERAVVIVDAPDWRTKASQKERDEARERGAIPVLSKNYEDALKMVKPAREVLEQLNVLNAENTLIWEEHGVWFRNRPDVISDDRLTVVDYKTTRNASPSFVKKAILSQSGYDIQAALSLRGLDSIVGENPNRNAVWLFQEREPPYVCSLVGLDNPGRELANKKIDLARGAWKAALETDIFPGYGNDIYWAETSPYSIIEVEDRAAVLKEEMNLDV